MSAGLPRLRAAFLCDGNPRDVATWSGIPSHMLRALEPHVQMVAVIEQPWAGWYRRLGRALKALTGRRFQYTASATFTRAAAAGTVARLRAAKPDVVFAVSARTIAQALVDEFQVVNVADATLRSMIGYYESFTRSVGVGVADADAMEARLIHGALLSLYPSSWACESAIEDYGADPDRVREIAWGSNIAASATVPRRLGEGPLRLLFVGAEWQRKGGPLAVAVASALAARGIGCRLDIVGSTADVMAGAPVPPNVVFHGFLGKGDPAQAATLDRLFADASFFLLPTSAECFGIVFAEAASRAMPSISIATGGVTSAVRDGVTGALLPLNATADAFAAVIQSIVTTPGRYEEMSAAALEDARTRLDWDVWAAAATAEVTRALREAAPPAAR